MKKDRICDSCSAKILKNQRYCLKIQLYAAPEVELDGNDISKDIKATLDEVMRKAKNMSAKKLEEDVYICYDLNLCKKCRDIFAKRIKLKEFI